MGFFSVLGKIGAGIAAPFTGGASLAAIPMIDAIGSGLGAASQSMTDNRSNQGNIEVQKIGLQQGQDRNFFNAMLDKDAAQRANAGDAWKRLLRSSYVAGGGMKSPGLAGAYSRPAPRPNASMVSAASDPALRQALLSRVNYQHDPYGGELPTRGLDFAALDKTGKSGFWEKLLGIGGAAASGYSAAASKAGTKPVIKN
jgi:hypothetical protein